MFTFFTEENGETISVKRGEETGQDKNRGKERCGDKKDRSSTAQCHGFQAAVLYCWPSGHL